MRENGTSDRLIKTPDWFKAPETRYPDAVSVVRRTFANVEEAEDYAGSLNIHAHYEQRLDIAQLSNEFLARLHDIRLELPATLIVEASFFRRNFPRVHTSISAMSESGVMFINPGADVWKALVESSRAAYAQGIWSTPSPLHVFFHEYAHLSQTEATRNKLLTPRQKTMAASVSLRAGTNTEEFLCEVYAGLMEGVQYDSDIIGAYRRLGGITPLGGKTP